MVQGKWFPMGGDIEQALEIRQAVFGRGADALDAMAQQVVVFREGQPVGAARLWWADGAFMLGDVGVLEEERHQGYGDLLVRLLLFKALSHNAGRVALDAPAESADFFAKYGFQSEGGSRMTIRGADVRLSHCGGSCEACGHPSPECLPKALR